MYTVYALCFDDGRIYVGMTSDLKRRIKEHQYGKTRSTKNRRIIRIIKIENCPSRIIARKREKYWKSGCGKEILKKFKYRGVEQSGSSCGS